MANILRKGKKKTFIKNIILSGASILVILGIMEVLLRLLGYAPLSYLEERNGDKHLILRPSPIAERIYELTPNSKGQAWGTSIQINSAGLRDREYQIPPPKNTYRILVAGDSITFGNNLPIEDTYPKQLENLLATSSRPIDVINLGLGGYDTLQEVSTIEHIGLSFQPDTVIIGYCFNDIGIESGNLTFIKEISQYQSPIYTLRVAQLIRNRLNRIHVRASIRQQNSEEFFLTQNRQLITNVQNDQQVSIFMKKIADAMQGRNKLHWMTDQYLSYNHVGKIRYAFERLSALRNAQNFEVLIVIIPLFDNVPSHQAVYQHIYRLVAYEATRLGFQTFNLFEVIRDENLEEMRMTDDDPVHPNVSGHRLIATKISIILKKMLIEYDRGRTNNS